MTRRWAAVLFVALPVAALADDDYRHGRIRYVEDGVTLQRAAEPAAEEAEPNIPFLPGDRIWTNDRGRVEFQFESGAFLRLDHETKLDYLDNPGDRVVLRLWSGGVYVHQVGGGDFEIETPGGVVETRGRGVYRIDARSGETRLSVYLGEAMLQGDRGARVRAGERVHARDGEIVRWPSAFDRRDADTFAMWDDERHERLREARQRPADLPEEASAYYDELYDHGSWDREPEIGYVWRPRVSFGWQPYTHGRWMWTAYGWTWLAHEPWGWAPFHYGRWGYSPAGWYWIPQRGWGPAWVNWAVGGPYVGWSPLGFRNRPIIVHHRSHRGGVAIPRAGSGAWVYARNGDMTSRDLARRRVQVDPAELGQIRALGSPRARLTKDLRVVDAPVSVKAGVPRTVRTKPTPGDTVPELRGGNDTISPPIARRRRDGAESRHDRGNSFGAAAGRAARARAVKDGGAPVPTAPAAPAEAAAAPAPADRPAARPASGGGDAGRTRYRKPEATAAPDAPAPVVVARPAADPVPRSRPRARDDGGADRSSESAGAPRQYAAPRQRSDDGAGRSGADRGGSERAAPRSRERAPRQEAAPPSAPREAPARDSGSSSGARRRQRD